MGGMITIDPNLLALAERGNAYRIPAATLARMQYNISRDLGHVVDLSRSVTWRLIERAAAGGKIPSTQARCVRCGAPATLSDWVTCALYRQAVRGNKYHQMKKDHGEIAARFLAVCRGERHAESTLEAIEAYAKELL